MNIVLASSIALLAIAAARSLVELRRSRDPRVWILFGLLFLLGTAEGAALWLAWGAPLRLDPATAGAFAALGASALAIWFVLSVGRTLAELDRTEALHWRSMEAVRALGELDDDPGLDTELRVARMLEIGCECFGLEIGLRSRVSGQRYEVAAIRAPEAFPIRAGAAFQLSETWCGPVLEARRPMDGQHMEGGAASRSAFPFGAYLGVGLQRDGRPIGTLVFASTRPRKARFTASEKDVLVLMARWLEAEIGRVAAPPGEPSNSGEPNLPPRTAVREPAPATPVPATSLSAGWQTRSIPASSVQAGPPARSLDLNTVLRRLRPRLERAAGAGVSLEFQLAAELAPACDTRLPLDAVVTSLVRHAAGAMQGRGEIAIATAEVELAAGAPDVFPAVAPDRYVTLRVRDSATGVDADGLARLFDDSEEDARDGLLALARIYRLLQGCGGDLSVEVEPGRGSTWTVFLPRHEGRSEASEERPERPTPHAQAHA